ncbi:MAG: hypothetical protein WC899_10705 [bacterium]|jgi:hypothetical protein
MADENRIHIEITGDPSGAVAATGAVDQANRQLSDGTKSVLSGLKGYYESFKRNWLEITAGITAAWLALQKMWSFMEKAAQIDESMGALGALTRQYGMTARDMTSQIGVASHGLIGMGDAARIAGDALMKGLRPEQIAQMASWAVTLEHIKGGAVSASEGFQLLSESISTGRERGLKALVGIVDLEAKYGDLASRMTQAEKAQAMYTIAAEKMTAIQKTLGDEALSSADRLTRFSNSIEKLKYYLGELLLLVGQPLIGVFQVAMTLGYGLAGAIATVIQNFARMTDFLHITQGATERWGQRSDEMFSNAANTAAEAKDNIASILETVHDLGKGAPLAAQGLGSVSAEVQKLNRQIDDLVAKNSLSDIELIRRQAAEYERQGASKVKVAEWVASEIGKIDREIAASGREAGEKRAQADIQAAQKVMEFRRKMGEVSDVAAIGAQYDAQARVLEVQRDKLSLDLLSERNTAKQASLWNQIVQTNRDLNAVEAERAFAIQAKELENARELAKAKLEESIRNKEAENSILESIDQQSLKMGLSTHAEITRAKYDREREVFRLRMEQELALSQVAGISAAEKLKYQEEYSRIERQLFDTRRLETNELNNTIIEQETILLNLARERANAEREHTAQRMQSMMSGLTTVASSAGAGFSGMAQGIGEMGAFAAGADPYTEQLAQLDLYHQQKLEKITLQAQAELEAKAAAGATEDELFASRQQWQAEMLDAYREWDAESAQTTEQRKLAIASTAMGTMGSLAESLYQLSGQRNKAAFNSMKAFRIAETVIDTIRGAQGAFSALAGIPYVGPILGIVAAAAAIAAGMARVRQISSMQPGGGTGASVSAGGAGMPSVPTAPSAPPVPSMEESKKEPTQAVNIHIYGNVVDQDKFARELVPSITKAIADGVR